MTTHTTQTGAETSAALNITRAAAEAIAACAGSGGLNGAIRQRRETIARRMAAGKTSPLAEQLLAELLEIDRRIDSGETSHEDVMFLARQLTA